MSRPVNARVGALGSGASGFSTRPAHQREHPDTLRSLGIPGLTRATERPQQGRDESARAIGVVTRCEPSQQSGRLRGRVVLPQRRLVCCRSSRPTGLAQRHATLSSRACGLEQPLAGGTPDAADIASAAPVPSPLACGLQERSDAIRVCSLSGEEARLSGAAEQHECRLPAGRLVPGTRGMRSGSGASPWALRRCD